jgi:type VI secretion system protein ImpF
MTTHQFERTVRPSVLDRLIDDPDVPDARTWEESVAALRRAVLRDVEWLLNTRQVYPPVPTALDLVRTSVYNFGLPELTSKSALSLSARAQLRRDMEVAINTYEPRLTRVNVTSPESSPDNLSVRLQIEAQLLLDPTPQPVTFETVLEAVSRAIVVRETGDA